MYTSAENSGFSKILVTYSIMQYPGIALSLPKTKFVFLNS